MFSIVATETSVLTFISIPSIAYRSDWTFLQICLGYIIGRIIISATLLNQYFSNRVISIYQILGEKFGFYIHKFSSIIFLITRLLADGIRYFATCSIIKIITGWEIYLCAIVVGIITFIYSSSGGIRGIIFIDSYQFIIYLISGVIIIIYAYSNIEFNKMIYNNYLYDNVFNMLYSNNKINFINISGNMFYNTSHLLSGLIGGAIFSIASHGVDYMMVQRVLACENLKNAKKAMIGSGIFVMFQFFIFLSCGTMLWVLYSGSDLVKDTEVSSFILNYLPIGLKGVLIAGVLSAAMSTLSSSINSLTSSVIYDLLDGFKVSVSSYRKIMTIFTILLILIATLVSNKNENLIIIGLKIASYTYGGLLSFFIIAMLDTHVSNKSVIVGFFAGIVSLLLIDWYTSISWIWFILISVSINITIVFYLELIRQSFEFINTNK